MRLVRPLGHEALAERLWGAARAGRLPHAVCVEGPAGTGKFALLAWFAAGLLCERGPGEPCLSCGPCKRVQAGGAGGGHADLLVIDPLEEGEEQIRIARIAERSGSADEPASVEAVNGPVSTGTPGSSSARRAALGGCARVSATRTRAPWRAR